MIEWLFKKLGWIPCRHHYHPTGARKIVKTPTECAEVVLDLPWEEGKCCHCGKLSWRKDYDDGNRG